MTDLEIKQILEKQLERLSEDSQRLDGTGLATATHAMTELASFLVHDFLMIETE